MRDTQPPDCMNVYAIGRARGRGSSARHRVVLRHQAALAARGVVAVDYAFGGGFVECADRVAHGSPGGSGIPGNNRDVRATHIGARGGNDRAVAGVATLCTADILDRRPDIWHGTFSLLTRSRLRTGAVATQHKLTPKTGMNHTIPENPVARNRHGEICTAKARRKWEGSFTTETQRTQRINQCILFVSSVSLW